MRMLFWNVGDAKGANKELPMLVGRLGRDYEPDLILLLEAVGSAATEPKVRGRADDMRRELAGRTGRDYVAIDGGPRGALLLWDSRGGVARPVPLFDGNSRDPDQYRAGGLHLVDADPPMLIVAVHAPSKLHATDVEQQLFFAKLREAVNQAEGSLQTVHTIAAGDFNADPFEPSIAATPFLNAVMARRLLRYAGRRVRGQTYGPGFYNPMWLLYGGRRGRPLGTYYFNRGRSHQLYWHMFDQVVLRSAILERNQLTELQIVGRVPGARFSAQELTRRATAGRPRPDHLPVFFSLVPRRS